VADPDHGKRHIDWLDDKVTTPVWGAFSNLTSTLGHRFAEIDELKAKTAEQGETISDLRDQVANLADIAAGLGRLMGAKDGIEVAVDLATAPAPAAAPPTSPPKPPTRPPASPPAPSSGMYWPSDTNDELRAERERLALDVGIQAPRLLRLMRWWRAHRVAFGKDWDSGIRSSQLYDRLQPCCGLPRTHLLERIRLLRRMGVLLHAGKGRLHHGHYMVVVAPGYRPKRREA